MAGNESLRSPQVSEHLVNSVCVLSVCACGVHVGHALSHELGISSRTTVFVKCRALHICIYSMSVRACMHLELKTEKSIFNL